MDMGNNLSVGQPRKHARKGVSRIVDESRELDFIRKGLEDKGLEPIWAKLIAEFGALMYSRGQHERLHRRADG
jgi:hypothetical protein